MGWDWAILGVSTAKARVSSGVQPSIFVGYSVGAGMEPTKSTMNREKGMAGLCIIQRISFQRSSGCFAPLGAARPQPPAKTTGLTPRLGGSTSAPRSS